MTLALRRVKVAESYIKFVIKEKLPQCKVGMNDTMAVNNDNSFQDLPGPFRLKFSSDCVFLTIIRKVAMSIVFDVDIVGSASGEAFSNSWMNAESVINHSFADDRLHIFFTRTARDFSDDLVVHKVYFGKDSNDQELVIIRALGGPSNSNLVRAIFGSLADALKSQVRKKSLNLMRNSQIAVALRHSRVLPFLPSKKMKGRGV